MLQFFEIEQIVDVRRFPGSRMFPQFNKGTLETNLSEYNITYIHIKNLGGRRKAEPDSKNQIWRHSLFKGYADYMATIDFKKGIEKLVAKTLKKRVAIMCLKGVWCQSVSQTTTEYIL